MSTPIRRVVVDDTDPAIQYDETGWFIADASALNALGNYGPVYNGTSHATTTSTSLSFPFNGTSVTVMGTIRITTDTTTKAVDPTWACFVDGIQIGESGSAFQFAENNWVLCDQPTIAPGAHNLTIKVTSKGQAFYLDNILYTPLPGDAHDGAVREYKNTDPAVSFGTGWQIWGQQNTTNTQGAQVALNFRGTSVTLIGYVPTELPHNATTGSYTVDGGSPVQFQLAGLAADSTTTVYNVVMFQTNTLTAAVHNIVATYAGSSKYTPLAVGTFYVTTSPEPASSSSAAAGGSTPTSDTSTTPVTTTKTSNTGAIAGGTIGCLVALALLAALFFWCRRRRRTQAENSATVPTDPFMTPATEHPLPVAAQFATQSHPPTHPTASGSNIGYSAFIAAEHNMQMHPPTPGTAGHPSPSPSTSMSQISPTGHPYLHPGATPTPPASSFSGSSHGHSPGHMRQTSDGALSSSSGGTYDTQQAYGGVYEPSLVARANEVVGGPLPTPVSSLNSGGDPMAGMSKLERERAAVAQLSPVRRGQSSRAADVLDLPPGYTRD